jgi:hypothetical protein
MKPNIFVCGASGTGKSTSLRNLDPERTCILNTERKALPFKGAGKFTHNHFIENYEEFLTFFERALKSDKFDTVVVESFTSLTEMIYRRARKMYQNFDIWDSYAKEIDYVLNISKIVDKNVVFLGIDEFLESDSGVTEQYVKVQGKVWRKSIEKEFVIVVFTKPRVDDDGKVTYHFITNTDGRTSAKSPMDMLPIEMPNDLALVIEEAENYYG